MSKKLNHKKTTFIANGKHFESYQAVEHYAKENNWIISNNETLAKGVHLITLTAANNES